jgi:hypothetical protein
MKQTDPNQPIEGDAGRQLSSEEPRGIHEQPQEPNQAALAVMHPDRDDPEWRYYFGAWHS